MPVSNEFTDRVQAIAQELYAKHYDKSKNECNMGSLGADLAERYPEYKDEVLSYINGIVSEMKAIKAENNVQQVTNLFPRPKKADIKLRPPLAPELIKGVVRKGHKMLLQGGSKIGKTFLQIELACCIASGQAWLGMDCMKGKALYLNMELDEADFMQRLTDVAENLHVSEETISENLYLWNLRGVKCSLSDPDMQQAIIESAKEVGAILVIIDPIYKVFTGSENDSESVAAFCGALDEIAKATGCTVCYCHHHSKGNQGLKRAMDRSSGSGVFARDADALIDFIEIDAKDVGIELEQGETAFRASFTLRSFPYKHPFELTFNYPLHAIREGLEKAGEKVGSDGANISKLGNRAKADTKARNIESLINAVINPEFTVMDGEGNLLPINTVKTAAQYFDVEEKTIRNWVRQSEGRLIVERGNIKYIPDLSETTPPPEEWEQGKLTL